MALTEQTVISKVEVLENNKVQVRQTRKIMDNGDVIAESHHRYVLQNGDDISGEDQKVQDICNAIWV